MKHFKFYSTLYLCLLVINLVASTNGFRITCALANILLKIPEFPINRPLNMILDEYTSIKDDIADKDIVLLSFKKIVTMITKTFTTTNRVSM